MKTVKSFGVMLYYLFIQIVVCFALVIFKFVTDHEWAERCMEVYTESFSIAASVDVTSELVLPALIITDLIIVIPLLFKSKFSMFRTLEGRNIVDLVALGLGCNIIVSSAITLLENLPIFESYNELMQFALNGDAVFMILSAGILAPFVEELCFRYWVFDILKEKSDTYKIVVSALIFGLAHLNIIQSTYAFLIGLILGYTYAKTKNLWCTILIHFSMNMSSVILELLPFYGQQVLKFIMVIGVLYSAYTLILKKNILQEIA